MTDDEALNAEIFAEHAVREVMRRFEGNNFATPKKAARKQREKQARSVVDGRSLRSKGRTEQLNVKVRPDIKEALAGRIEADGITIADFMEHMLEAELGMRGN